METLIIGLILFFVPHSVSIVAEPWRNRMAARLGEQKWMGLYALVSLIGLLLIIWGYGQARLTPTVLFIPSPSLYPVTGVLLLPVFPLLIATYLPGRIRAATRHPMLLATMLWAGGHLLTNGMLADVLLFGTFLIWAIADRISMIRRVQRPLPELPRTGFNDAIAVVVGLGIYVAFLFDLHARLIGVPLMG